MRVKLENEQYRLAYGTDHLEGLFIEVYGKNPDRLELVIKGTDKSTFLTIEKIVATAGSYGFDLSHELDDGSGFEGSGCGGGCETCQRLGV